MLHRSWFARTRASGAIASWLLLVAGCALPHGAVHPGIDGSPEGGDARGDHVVDADVQDAPFDTEVDAPCGSPTDPLNCGTCGHACATGQVCVASACTTMCPMGQHLCAGRCSDPLFDPQNCGACGTACPTGMLCSNGSCMCPATLTPCVGACVNTQSDGANCGACNHPCPTGDSCSLGVCVSHCPSGQTMCGSSCVDESTDPNNCGGCGTVCAAAHATVACHSHMCGISMCDPGYQNCDGMYANGCETDTSSMAANCGACGHVCGSTNGTPTCTGGTCFISCASGYADCDHTNANGCEVHTATDTNNCGTCGNHCMLANATSGCSAGSCTVMSCMSTFHDCNGIASDGCEANVVTDPNNCGACGHACSVMNGTANCTSSTCGIAGCTSGFGNCNGNIGDGCEVNLLTDSNNCGTCGHACAAGTSCSGGLCMCTPPTTICSGTCVNTQSSMSNCGTCGHACPVGSSCSGGTCICVVGTYCSTTNSCVDLQGDVMNCGSCAHVCAAGQVCTMGACVTPPGG